MSAPALLEQLGEQVASEGLTGRLRWRALPWHMVGRWVEHRVFGRVLLLVVLVGVVLAVPPTGEFPVDDDGIYAQTVQQLLTDGQYHRSVWIDSAFLAQAWWGASV